MAILSIGCQPQCSILCYPNPNPDRLPDPRSSIFGYIERVTSVYVADMNMIERTPAFWIRKLNLSAVMKDGHFCTLLY